MSKQHLLQRQRVRFAQWPVMRNLGSMPKQRGRSFTLSVSGFSVRHEAHVSQRDTNPPGKWRPTTPVARFGSVKETTWTKRNQARCQAATRKGEVIEPRNGFVGVAAGLEKPMPLHRAGR